MVELWLNTFIKVDGIITYTCYKVVLTSDDVARMSQDRRNKVVTIFLYHECIQLMSSKNLLILKVFPLQISQRSATTGRRFTTSVTENANANVENWSNVVDFEKSSQT